ncbi:MAG: 30S ribosomal protein S1 [Planctomycetes bacterium]|nr:30S ribosomal protein S1 [Planctomycetota bacterium]
MVDRNIFSTLGISEEELNCEVQAIFGESESTMLEETLESKMASLEPGTILEGKIVLRLGNDVIVELGLKSEGIVDASEFDDPEEIVAGKKIEVLIEEVDAEGGILLNKRKADRIRGWERVIANNAEGDIVTGRVTRRIKGGLLVDIGVPVFLPASQVDIRKPGDISRFIGQELECKILKIDTENHNIVVSRRKLIEEERKSSKETILKEIEVGQVRKGIVKNIADFGVFVDLGGLDGLLHISDLSWGRISHPSEIVQFDQEIECMVIGVDKDNEKISLGLKQKVQSPWQTAEDRYPISSRVKGTVVNIMNYGAFIRLEEGIEGLVHISEMSWTRRIAHPADILNLNEDIEVVVLDVNKDKQEISLGIKQLETNPWTIASQKYPPGTIINAKVTGLTNYGAFVEIEPGIDGLIHISDMNWTKKFNHPSEAYDKGVEIKCLVLEVDEGKHRVSLGVKQMTADPWIHAIPEKYLPGQIVHGIVTKLTNFGVFIELEPDLEGLLHISELSDEKIDKPQDVVNLGDELEVKILRVDTDARKIGLSLRRVQWAAESDAGEKLSTEEQAKISEDMEVMGDAPQRRGGLDGMLIPNSVTLETEGDKEAKAAAEEAVAEEAVAEEAVAEEAVAEEAVAAEESAVKEQETEEAPAEEADSGADETENIESKESDENQ